RRAASSRDSHAKRIVLVEKELGFGRHVSRARDARIDHAVHDLHRSLENAADDALLTPFLPGAQLAVGDQTSELGAGAGAARGAVVGSARTENEVAAVRAKRGRGRGTEQFHVVDLLTVIARDTLPSQRLTDPPGHFGQ